MCLDRFVCAFLLEKMKGDESFSLPWILSYLRSFYNGDRKNGSQNWRSVTYIDQKNPSPPEEHFTIQALIVWMPIINKTLVIKR